MAEIISSKKTIPRVDLTPMVDLGFLLITFFMITSALKEQKVMRFFLPANGESTSVGESTALTLVPTEDNSIQYFFGSLEQALQKKQLGITGFSLSGGIGQLLRDKKSALRKMGKENDMIVVICPDSGSSYKNLVDLMDEMVINGIPKYCLVNDEKMVAELNDAIKQKGN